MAGGYTQRFTGDSAELLREYRKLEQSVTKMEDELRKLRQESERGGQAAQEHGRQATGAYDKMQRELKELQTKIRNVRAEGGVVDPKELQRIEELQGKLRDARGEMDGLSGASSSVGAANQKAFGKEALAQLGQYAIGVASLSTAFEGLKAVVADYFEDMRKGKDAIEGRTIGIRDLASVASSSGDLQQMKRESRELQLRFGMDSQEAMKMVFDAQSTGFRDSILDVAEASQLVGAEVAGVTAGKVRGLFSREQMTAKQAIAMGVVAAENSVANFEELMINAPQAAELAGASGTGANEMFALLSVMSGKFKGPAEAAERIKAFMGKVMLDDELKNLGVMGAFERLQAGDPERLKEFLGSDTSVNALFGALQDSGDDVSRMISAISNERSRSANGGGVFQAKLNILLSDAETRAKRDRDIARMREEGALIDPGIVGMELEALQSQINADEQSMSPVRRYVNRWGRWISKANPFGGEEGTLEGTARMMAGVVENEAAAAAQAADREMQRILEEDRQKQQETLDTLKGIHAELKAGNAKNAAAPNLHQAANAAARNAGE